MKRKNFYILIILLLSLVVDSLADTEFLAGADISALTRLEEWGAVYKENGEQKDFVQILKDNGYNTIRLRLFVNPVKRDIVVNDLPYTLNLARRVKEKGFKILLNFHYSDTWADPGKQTKPAAWENLPFEQLCRKVQSYTSEVITVFKDEKLLPEYVQIGNEITPGFLWPDGKITDDEEQYAKFISLLKAGIDGVRQAAPEDKVKIILHIDRGGDKELSKSFFSRINKYDVEYDIIALSYYPFWHGKLKDLKENLAYISEEFQKDIILMETAFKHRSRDDSLVAGFTETVQGQYDFLFKLTQTVLDTPQEHGIGIFYWYPEGIQLKNRRIWQGGATALFDSEGNALPGLKAFSDAVSQSKKSEEIKNEPEQ